MTPTIKKLAFPAVFAVFAVFALVACLAIGCDTTDPTVTTDTSALVCNAGTFRLVGSIDDMSIDVMQPANTGGFSQTDGGDFGSINNTIDPAGTLTDLHVTWTRGIAVGATTAAKGTVQIPTSPFPETFCAGKDSTVHSVADAQGGGLQFYLSSLASGADCATARRGSLRACWSP